MLKATDVVQYFLIRSNDDENNPASNLLIRKLLHYAQERSLAVYDRPLFEEEIQALLQTPVVPEVYRGFKKRVATTPPVSLDMSIFTPEDVRIMDEVWNSYGQFTAIFWRTSRRYGMRPGSHPQLSIAQSK